MNLTSSFGPTVSVGEAEILIVGGGIIGASCCYELARRGAKVTLIDKGEVGHGCSYGNAGWLTPCFATPLPMPGMLLKSIKWAMDSQSPLYIQPRASLYLSRWLWRFVRSMTTAKLNASTDALTALSKLSLEAYRALDQQSPGAFGFTPRGLLLLAQTGDGMKSALRDKDLMDGRGVPSRKLSPDELRQLEPAVRGKELAGGVYFPNEAHAEPLATVAHLIELARKYGATILPKTEVLDWSRTNGSITSVLTSRGPMRAGRIVLATGAWSGRLAGKLGIRVPMLSGKGYAVIVPPLEHMPSMPIMVVDRKIAITPRNGSLRLAGTLELVDLDESVTMTRVQAILRGAGTVLELPEKLEIKEIWRGLRPCTPDGVPLIGRAPGIDNLFIAAGHQMLGLQSGLGTGMLLADLVTGSTPCVDPTAFRVERFN